MTFLPLTLLGVFLAIVVLAPVPIMPRLPFFDVPYIYDLRDFLPAHFHFFRDSRSGELGFFAALVCFFI